LQVSKETLNLKVKFYEKIKIQYDKNKEQVKSIEAQIRV
jgi:hypothetical protein